MNTVSQWPPRTRDVQATVEAYERVLGWPLIVNATLVSAQRALAVLACDLDATLSVPCSGFDAVSMPYRVGVELLVLLGRQGTDHVPALINAEVDVVFLVQLATGTELAEMPGVSIASGPGGRLFVPPSHGWHWDTPPWQPRAAQAVELLPGREIASPLRTALRMTNGTAP
ncbi:hypothetical protein [Streptomyces goshikiensis]|uniref:hypothetical protein n=1 Tax=Streptomyces goshikiensis TaxID=1942 RepID=UPI0036621C9B